MLSKFRQYFSKIIDPLARSMVKIGINPNTLTVLGVVSSVVYVILAWYNVLVYAIVMVFLAGFFDVLDGAVARMSGKISSIGEFLDSTLDRVSDALLISGLFLIGIDAFLVILLLLFSFLVSYVRAKGELLGLKMEGIGFIERAERIIFIAIIVVLRMIDLFVAEIVTLIFLALTVMTFINRFIYVLKSLT